MKKKPIIGISGNVMIDKSGDFAGYRRAYVNEDYVNAIIKNGGVPYIIPVNNDSDVIFTQIQNIDGLILSGGHDVSPRYYGEEPHNKLGEIYPERDEFDFKLLEYAIDKKIPILGICRGFQLINVYFGGSLYQDLSLNKEVYIRHNQVTSPLVTTHTVDINMDTRIGKMIGEESIYVNSFHHQILKRVADNFVVAARSKDGVVEAIEDRTYDFLMGLQWHPEMLHSKVDMMNVFFKKLIDMANKKEK